mmetsp:Transcript_141/g.282  ORF Transcript_141/g.282 Transcript_141/m.282 type:complete len:296 (-) Transcript_141:70-957(-)
MRGSRRFSSSLRASACQRPSAAASMMQLTLILLSLHYYEHPASMVSAFAPCPSSRHISNAACQTIYRACSGRNAGQGTGIFALRVKQASPATIQRASPATAQDTADSKPTIKGRLATSEEIIQYGEDVGVKVSLSTLGPGYRAVARSIHDEEQIIGYVEGFLRPGGKILHLDKMEVWKKAVDRARKENPDGYKNGGNVFGVGLLLGYLCLLHGQENGCTEAEFLAIDDEEYQHKRLVRYYRNSGFKVIKYVGEGVGDIPDRLVWGGCGTLMRQEVDVLLDKWTKSLFQRIDDEEE